MIYILFKAKTININKMSSTKKNNTIKYQDFTPSDLKFKKFDEPNFGKGKDTKPSSQLISFTEKEFDIQTPWIKLYTYGIPRLGQYYKTDSSRTFIKVPLNQDDSDVTEFLTKMQGIDEYMKSKEFKTMQFGAKADKYNYINIVRFPEEDEEEENKSKYPKPPYMKIKIDLHWNPDTTAEPKIKTAVSTSILKDGVRVNENKNIESMTEFADLVSYNSTIRMIIKPVKAWCEKKAKSGNSHMLYGVTFKLIKVQVEPNMKANNLLSVDNSAFIDSDDEHDEPKFKGKPTEVKTGTLPLKKVVKEESEDEEDEEEEEEESEDDEDPIPEPEPVKKGKTTKAPVKNKK